VPEARAMADREAMLRAIDLLYVRRVKGDKAGIAELLAPGATFRIAGDSLPIPGVPPGEGPADRKIADLIDAFVFHDIKRLDALVDDHRVAVLSRARISPAGGDEITAELYDLWTFDREGKITAGLQFGDAALVGRLLAMA
jgi:ketosteroid isomerase-like protein